jgi:hypothetical protein
LFYARVVIKGDLEFECIVASLRVIISLNDDPLNETHTIAALIRNNRRLAATDGVYSATAIDLVGSVIECRHSDRRLIAATDQHIYRLERLCDKACGLARIRKCELLLLILCQQIDSSDLPDLEQHGVKAYICALNSELSCAIRC